MEEDRIVFSIEGTDFEKVKEFKSKHDNCIYEHPNISCAQFEYSFVPDGFGVLGSVTCVCGDSIILDSGYDSFCETGKKNFEVVPKDDGTLLVVKTLLGMKHRPGMYFGKDKNITCLRSWISGYLMAMFKQGEKMYWCEMQLDVELEYERRTKDKDYSNEELFDIYLESLEDILRNRYPIFSEENHLFD